MSKNNNNLSLFQSLFLMIGVLALVVAAVYKVKTINAPDKVVAQYNAIFQIGTKLGDSWAACTAFVVSDEHALTASHCIETVPGDINLWNKHKIIVV